MLFRSPLPSIVMFVVLTPSFRLHRYFRQLQEISDTVAEPAWEGYITDAIVSGQVQSKDLDAKINTERARLRYLDNLVSAENDEGSTEKGAQEEERTCILCKSEFTRGYITHWYVLPFFWPFSTFKY